MTKNYDSVVTRLFKSSTISSTQEATSYSTKKRNYLSFLTVFVMLFSFVFTQAQSISNYAFTNGTNGTLVDLTLGSTSYLAGNLDDAAGTVQALGFDFTFMGTKYTHFSANSNGQMQLHTISTATAIGTNVSTGLNTAILAPFTGDNEVNNGLRFKVLGTTPNRTFVLEWNQFYINYVNLSNAGNMQVWLNEGTGKITYIYGEIYNSATTAQTRAISLASSNTATTVGSITIGATPIFTAGATPTPNTIAVGANPVGSPLIANIGSASQGSRVFFTFTPPNIVSGDVTNLTFTAVTQNGTTLNWTDNATNEAAFVVIRATDAAFSQNVVSTAVTSTTSAGTGTAYTSAQTVLSAGTNYFYKVVTAVEGGQSSGITGNQATLNGATYYWTGITGDLWNTFTNWNTSADGTGSVPTAWATSDVHVIDGAGTTPGGTLSISVDRTSFTVGQVKITNNTNLTLASSATTTRTITISGGPNEDFVLENGSTLNLNSATNAVAFAFTGSGNTGTLAGTYIASGSTSNTINTTGGTGTLVTVNSTGNITSNLNSSSGCITGNATSLLFENGSNFTHSNSTTINYIPTATWQPTATATLNGNTTGTTLTSGSTSLGNLIINNTLSTSTLSAFTSNVRTIQGNLTINSTGTGRFRAKTSGLVTINGNLIINAGIFEVGSASGGGVIVKGNTIVAPGATLDFNQSILQNEGNMINDGSALSSETTTINSALNFIGTTTPQTLSGSGTFTGRISSFGVSNPSGLTISTPVLTQRVNLFTGLLTGSSNITIGTGLALGAAVQIGTAGNTNPGGNFDISPVFNLGTGSYTIFYLEETTPRTTGFEVPPTRSVNNVTLDNTNGLTISGGTIEVLNGLTLTNGIVTSTLANHVIHGSATTVGLLTGGSATSYVNGPIVRTISDANASTNYVLYPVGKAGVYAPIWLAPATTSASKFKAEAFSSNVGTSDPSIIGLSTTRRWEAITTSGTFTDINVRLADATIASTNIPVQAPSAAGVYSSAFGSVATYAAGTPNTVQSDFTVTSSSYTGFLSFANSNACTGTPVPGNTIASSSSICFGESVTLSLQNITNGSGVTYQWKSSTDGTTYSTIPGATNSSLTIIPTVATYYICDVTCSAGPLTGTSVAVQVNFSNSITTTTPVTRCGTGTVDLAATPNTGASVNWYTAQTGGSLLGSGNNFTTPSITSTTTYYAAAVTSNAGNIALGTGLTNSSSTAASFLPGSWGGTKTQYIIRASELMQSGLSAGPITSLGFEPTNSGQTYQGFYVNVGHTASTTAPTGTFIPNTGLTFVYAGTEANDGFTPVANTLNNLNFGSGTGTTSSFIWDGTSNIVVSISWSRVPSASTATSTTMKVDNVGFVSTAYRQRDNLTPAAMLDETFVNSTSSNRPRFTINGQLLCSSTRVPVVASVTTPPTLTLSDSTATICESDTSAAVTVTSIVGDYNTYTWSPSTGVSGNENTGWSFNPSTTTTYTLTATQTSGSLCSSTANFTVSVNSRPSIMTIADATVCVDAIQSLVLSGGTIGVEGKVGSGSLTNTTSTPFRGFYGGSKTQALYTASELTALGMVAGQNINTIGYVALSGTPLVLNNFTINAGFVSDSNLGSSFISGATNVVLAPVNYTPSTGSGNLDFILTTPLNWDGTSNLLIETCFNNNNGGGASTNSISVESSTVATGLNLYRSQDSTADVCSNTTAPSSSLTRPNLRISTIESTLTTWSPVTNLYSDAAATVAYVANTNVPTVYFKSSTAAAATTYTATATSAFGCSRTATTNVTVNALTSNSTTISACDSYTWAENGMTYTASGAYTSVTGCNTETLNLTITTSSSLPNEVVTACDTYTWAANGTTYTTGGTYTSTTNCVTKTLVLTITTSSSLPNEVVTACDTYTWAANGTTYTTGGTYTSTTNCVTRTLNLTITTSSSLPNEVITACDTYTWAANGTTYTTGGSYTSTTNCVTRTLNLTITTSSSLPNEVVSACATYTWTANGTTYTTGGTYTSTTNCVTRTLNLTINALPNNATSQSGDTLSATENGATYQWVLCDGSFTPISGATSQSYMVTAIGSYAVEVTKNGCMLRSACINVTTLGGTTFNLSKLKYYPNPVLDIFTVSNSENITSIDVYDLSGRRVKKNTSNNTEVTIDMSDLAASVYVVKVFSEGKSTEFKIVKK